MAPDGSQPLALGAQGTTSHRLAATVAGDGQINTAAFKQYSSSGGSTSDAECKYVLVPDVTPEAFEGFLKEVKAVVGDANVYVNLGGAAEQDGHSDYLHLPHFEDFFKVDEPEKYMASAHIQPASVEEVSQVVKIANKYKQPLHTVSMGRNVSSSKHAFFGWACLTLHACSSATAAPRYACVARRSWT